MEIERLSPSIWWECPYCGEKLEFPVEARGHLISKHSPSDTSAQTERSALAIPNFGDEEDMRGKRFRLHCPFCETGTAHASFKTKALLKAHLTNVHGCS